MTYTEIKSELMDAALHSLERGAPLADVLLQAFEMGRRERSS